MQSLLDKPVDYRGHTKCTYPARGLGDIHPTHRPRQIPTFQQRLLHARPVHLEPVFELGTAVTSSTPGAPLFSMTRWYASLKLLRSTTRSMSSWSSDFVRPDVAVPSSAPPSLRARLPACTPRRRPPLRVLLLHRFASRSSVLLSASLFGPSAPSPTMASADFWPPISTTSRSPIAQRQIARSPRVLRTLFHAYARRIYGTAFRTRIGLCIFSPAYPRSDASIRFLFVAPALCLRLPSDPRSPGEPLPCS